MPESFDKDLILQERLAFGGMGEVFRGVQVGVGGFEKAVAIKRILPTVAAVGDFREMFLRETNICARLQHPNIAQVYRNGLFNGYLYLVMEHVEGKNIDELLKTSRRDQIAVPVPLACLIIAEAAKGLHYAHTLKDDRSGESLQIIHRDISPSNLMISYRGEVKIIDFGIARAANTTRLTKSGFLKGKENYLAPELINGEEADARTDLFCLGVIFFELLTQKRLFEAPNTYALFYKITRCEVPDIHQLNPVVDHQLAEIVQTTLAGSREDRYQTAGELHRALSQYLSSHFPHIGSEQLAEFMSRLFRQEIEEEAQRRKDNAAAETETLQALTASQAAAAVGGTTATSALSMSMPLPTQVIYRRQMLLISTLVMLNIAMVLFLLREQGIGPFRSKPAPPASSGAAAGPIRRIAPPAGSAAPARAGQNAPAPAAEVSPELLSVSVVPLSPAQLSNLLAWYDADKLELSNLQQVPKWPDSGPLHYDAQPLEVQNQPILSVDSTSGRKTLAFDGMGRFLVSDRLAVAMRSLEAMTVCYVAKPADKRTRYVWSVHGENRLFDILRSGFREGSSLRTKSDSKIGSYNDSPPVRIDRMAVYCAVFEPYQSLLYQNGLLRVSAPIASPVPYSRSTYFSIGQDWDVHGPSDFYSGDLAELVVFGRALTQGERLGLERYLVEKYQINAAPEHKQ